MMALQVMSKRSRATSPFLAKLVQGEQPTRITNNDEFEQIRHVRHLEG